MARGFEKENETHLKGKSVKKFLIVWAFLPSFILASSGSGDYDIVPRAVNFLIFAAILVYLLKNPAKNFYNNRIAKIASRLDDIQKRVLDSKNKKLEMIKQLESAKKDAENAVEFAQKEAEILSQKIKEDTKNELHLLERYFEEQKDYEQRKMQKEVIASILNEMFADKKNELSQDEILAIMLKKVS